MQFLKSPKFLIFLIVFVNFLGYGIVFPLLPILTEQYGGDPLLSGILIGVFSLMQVISMPILGRFSDKWGRKPLLLYSLWGTVLSFFIMAVTHSIFWLLVARIIDGISGGNLSIAQAYIADKTDRKGRAAGMGVIAAGISLGFIMGPLWGGILAKISIGAPFYAAAAITVVSCLLTQFFLPESVSAQEKSYEKKHFDFRFLFKDFRNSLMFFLFVANLLLFWAQSGLYTIMSLYGKDVLHLSLVGVSVLFAFGGILSAIIQGFLIGKTLKIIPEKKLFLYSALVATIGMAVLSKATSNVSFFFGMMIFSIGNSFLMPVLQSLVSEGSSEHEQGGNLGLLQSFGSIGRIFGPIIAGYVYQTISPGSPAVMGVIMLGLIFIYALKIFKPSSLL